MAEANPPFALAWPRKTELIRDVASWKSLANHPTAVAIRTAHHGCRITNPNTKILPATRLLKLVILPASNRSSAASLSALVGGILPRSRTANPITPLRKPATSQTAANDQSLFTIPTESPATQTTKKNPRMRSNRRWACEKSSVIKVTPRYITF
jgi:hypothetical protein